MGRTMVSRLSCSVFRRFPAGRAATPNRRLATVMAERYKVSSGCASIHSMTPVWGALRNGSEMTLVSTRIIKYPGVQPVLCHVG